MTILEKLESLDAAKVSLTITPQEYQQLCLEVFALGMPLAANYDELILGYKFNGSDVLVQDPTQE